MTGTPVKIGILWDEAVQPSWYLKSMRLKLDEFNAAGGVEGRLVEIVDRVGDGAHEGLPGNLVPAYRELVDDPAIVGILGPNITDNCLVLIDEVDRARTPTLCWPGSEDCRGEWYFQYQIGNFTDETLFLARAMVRAGHRRVGVVQAGTTGMHYYHHFEREARFLGLGIVGKEYVHVHQADVGQELGRLRRADPDAILFLGMGAPTLPFCRTPAEMGWDVPRYGNLAFLQIGWLGADELSRYEGTMWVDQYEPKNRTLQAFEEKYRARYGEAPLPTPLAPAGWDLMTLICEGLLRAPNLSRAGLKAGLENVKQVPAAMGGERPVMGFCKWDRQALKGPDILNYRRVRNGRVESFVP
jgi:branched-chain amino acid transport system substrate-binding protein